MFSILQTTRIQSKQKLKDPLSVKYVEDFIATLNISNNICEFMQVLLCFFKNVLSI